MQIKPKYPPWPELRVYNKAEDTMVNIKLELETLEKVMIPLRESALEGLNILFGHEAEVHKDFIPVNSVVNPMEQGCNVLASNDLYQCCLTLGVNSTDLAGIIGQEGEPDFLMDALGELGNQIAGAISEKDAVVQEFGFMEQSTPLFITGGSSFKSTPGVQGTLLVGYSKLFVGFTVWRKGSKDL